MTHQLKTRYSLLRGCSLFEFAAGDRAQPHYLIGSYSNVVAVTSAHQRTALTQLARGEDPLETVSESVRENLRGFISTLMQRGLLNDRAQELRTPARNLDEISASDIAINQLRARSAPELLQSEWIDSVGDGGTSTLVARAQHLVELSGRSRVITLLYSILLASGVTQIRFSDPHFKPVVSDLDIGFGALSMSDFGAHYYETHLRRQRQLSLFPIDRAVTADSHCATPIIAIHSGDCDPVQLLEWSNKKIPHLVIHPPVGDEVVVGPTVIPGETPCNRCLSLYEIDNFGFTTSNRIELTAVDELPTATAHYVAAIVASQILNFIDYLNSDKSKEIIRNTGIGEITYINFQRLNEPQVVAIARHPLCGCDA